MLQRFFDWLDDAASRVLRIAYLIPFVIATALYFGGTLPGFLQAFMTGLLPWTLAFAVETQTYVSVRKMAVIWNGLKAATIEDFQRRQLRIEMAVQAGIVLALASFSVWNQASYLAETWHPADSAFGAPLWLDIAIRSVGPAAFFFLTAFGAPLAKTIGEKLAEEAHKTLDGFLGVLTGQRKRAIRKISGQMNDMTEAIHTVGTAANERRSSAVLASIQSAIVRLANDEAAPALPAPSFHASSISAPGHSRKSMLEEVRLVYRKGMSAREVAAKVGCSEKTARRHMQALDDSFVVTKRISAVK